MKVQEAIKQAERYLEQKDHGSLGDAVAVLINFAERCIKIHDDTEVHSGLAADIYDKAVERDY